MYPWVIRFTPLLIDAARLGIRCWSGPVTSVNDGVEWSDLGDDYFDRRQSPEYRAKRNLVELRSLGCTVTTNNDGTTTIAPPIAA